MSRTYGTKKDRTPITDEMIEEMADEAERGEGVSVSTLIRKALRKYVKAS